MEKLFLLNQNLLQESWELTFEDWGNCTRKKLPKNLTHILAKYGVLSLYYIDFDKRYSIDDGEIHFVKGYGYALIGYPDHPYGTSTDHEYFFIHDEFLTES